MTDQLKSDEERGFQLGHGQQETDVEKIAKTNRAFEKEKAERERSEIAQAVIDEEKRQKIGAARDQLVNLLVEGHADEVRDFADGLTADDRTALVSSLKEGDDNEDKGGLSPEAQALVDSVMAKK